MEIGHDYARTKRAHPSTDEELGHLLTTIKNHRNSIAILKKSRKKNVINSVTALDKDEGQINSRIGTHIDTNKTNVLLISDLDTEFARSKSPIQDSEKYDVFSSGPFIVHVRLSSISSKNNNQTNQLSLLTIAKNIDKDTLNILLSANTADKTFSSKTLANSSLENKFLKELGLIAFIPRYKINRKIIMRDIPLDTELDYLK